MGALAICVSRDAEVRRIVGEALGAAGVEVAHHAEWPRALDGAAMVVVDRAIRQAADAALRELAVPVVVVGDDLDDDRLITLMLDGAVSHLVGDPGDRDLGITSEKLVSGDLFGLEKYVARGAVVRERAIANDVDKRVAMGEVSAWAEAIGARRPVVHRLASVVDELLMNAMIDAPRESQPILASSGTATLRWAADDRVLAISVADGYGAIRQRDVIDHVRRARSERGRPESGRDVGAGLGLYLVLANVASLIVNVESGRRTEVVCLFDLARKERRAVVGRVRSLHVFAAG
ncbi:MAG TPA: hypothetical protein VLX92_05930 [Kofleriaceae bacterium]|nr:hypothetical protein [Kofleriaceae bacterium]